MVIVKHGAMMPKKIEMMGTVASELFRQHRF
jgi:hypothetical protein